MKLSRHLLFFSVLLFCFAVLQIGCWQKNDKNPVAALPDSTLTSSVAFKIVTPSNKTASFTASILAVAENQAFVTFQLKLANFGNSLTPFSLVKKQVPVLNGSATVSFESLPNTTVVGSLQIENGNIDGFSNFHGAADLNQGSNIVELAPVGSLMPQDVLANAVSEIVSSTTLLLKAPTSLAAELAKIVSNLPLDSNSVYDEVLNNFSNRTGLPLVELLAPAREQTFTIGTNINIVASATDLDGSISKVEFYQNSTKIGEKSSLPFSFDWQPAVAGVYKLYVKAFDNNSAVGISASITVNVKAAPTYTVSYNGNGNTGGTVPTDNKTYQQNATVTAADNTGNLAKTGYTFAGWNTAADGSGTSYNPAAIFNIGTANTTLFAKWLLIPTYTVTYNGNGNTGGTVPTDIQTYQQNATVTVADNAGNLTKTGYTFAGWNTAADGSGTSYAAVTTFAIDAANVTLYAKWSKNPTLVNGIISADTTWSLENSPYELTGKVQIAENCTLTIAPGVTIYGDNQVIEVFGNLKAIGNSNSQITFLQSIIKLGNQDFSATSLIDFDYLSFNSGSLLPRSTGYGSINLRNSTITDSAAYMYIWYPVRDCVIERNVFKNSGGLGVGTDKTIKVFIQNNVFLGQKGDSSRIFAVEVWATYNTSQTMVKYNSFLSKDRIAVQLPTGYNNAKMIAVDNFWNTTNSNEIAARIFDKNDDLGCAGFIEFEPFLSAPHQDTPDPNPYL